MDRDPATVLFSEIEPPQELFSLVMHRVMHARRRSARIALAAFGMATFISVFLFIQAAQYALSEFYTSGFYEYASLFFDSVAHGYSQDVLYSLVDSLPSFALLFLIVSGGVLVWSIRHTNQTVRVAFTRAAVAA